MILLHDGAAGRGSGQWQTEKSKPRRGTFPGTASAYENTSVGYLYVIIYNIIIAHSSQGRKRAASAKKFALLKGGTILYNDTDTYAAGFREGPMYSGLAREPAPQNRREIMRKDRYKVVIVGFAHVHINDVAGHFYGHPRIDLCGAADMPPAVPERRSDAVYTRAWNVEYCRKKYGVKLYGDWKQMLDETKPDLCVVSSENCFHVQITGECARRGIGVCIEKPMAATLSDAVGMYRAVRAYGTFCMVNWPITWNAGLQTVKRMVDEGFIGDIIEIKTRMGHTGPLGPGAKHHIDETAEPMTEIEKCSTWWHQTAAGGGAMADYCCYGSIVSCWMAGKSAVAAMGMRINSIHALADAEDNAAMLVRFPDCYAVLEGTWTTYNHTFKSPIVYGTKGALVGDYKTGKVQFYRTDGTVEDIENDVLPEHLKDIACAYVHHMDTGEPTPYTTRPEFNLDAMAVLDAGIRSAGSGKMEPVNNCHWQIG